MPPAILIIDDDKRMGELLRDTLAEENLEATVSTDSREALRLLSENPLDIVITDLKMPHHDGIAVLERAREINPEIVVILITGYGSIETAIEAIRKGAYDYIQKPFEPDDFLLTINRAVDHVTLLHENRRLRQQIAENRTGSRWEMIGDSPQMLSLRETIERIAPFDTTVLIEGETGTGKELVARLLHLGSPRKEMPFMAVNCGALSEELLESELFGHEKGAFTGADRRKKGLFETAEKGTVFLDEVNATSSNFQVKLLRVLQEGQVMRVGSSHPTPVDVRVIAASNSPLGAEVEAGRFRQDLFYRLNVFTITLPPLRKRRPDIPLLAYHFLHRFSRKFNLEVKTITPTAMDKLLRHDWPGNVRELENTIQRAVLLAESPAIRTIQLPQKSTVPKDIDEACSKMISIAEMEKMLISHTLQAVNGHRERTAEILGISPATLWRKMKKYNLH
ncbi:MAG: sigma-54 dependent transcriptional regulator [Desulfobulbaceae bacterium]